MHGLHSRPMPAVLPWRQKLHAKALSLARGTRTNSPSPHHLARERRRGQATCGRPAGVVAGLAVARRGERGGVLALLSRRALRDTKAAAFRRSLEGCEQAHHHQMRSRHACTAARTRHTIKPEAEVEARGRPSRAGGLEAVGGRGRHRRARVDFAPVVERCERILLVLRLPPAPTASGTRLCVDDLQRH